MHHETRSISVEYRVNGSTPYAHTLEVEEGATFKDLLPGLASALKQANQVPINFTWGVYQDRLLFQQGHSPLASLADTITEFGKTVAVINISICLPVRTQRGLEFLAWDSLLAELGKQHQGGDRHRLFGDLRSLVFVGGNGTGKSSLIEHLSTWNDFMGLPSDFPLECISARRNNLVVPPPPLREGPRLPDFEVVKKDQLADIFSEAAARSARVQDKPPSVRAHVIPGLNEAIREIIAGHVRRDPAIDQRLKILNSIYGRLFPRLWIGVVVASAHGISPDESDLALIAKRKGVRLSVHQLSDGEKDVLFLIWRMLSLSDRSFVLIDEPEAHLHRSAVDVLWSELERAKPLCFFAYFTHDLSFAATRMHSEIVCLHSYNSTPSQEWTWSLVPRQRVIAPEVLLNIVGSRGQRVLYTEGDNYNSLDYQLYHEVYGQDWLVIPRGGCSQVLDSVKAIGDTVNPLLGHPITAAGIIDRDFHPDTYFKKLERIYPLAVAEVENFFCTPEIVKAVAVWKGENPETAWSRVEDNILSFFSPGTDEFNYQIEKSESPGEVNAKEQIDSLKGAIKILERREEAKLHLTALRQLCSAWTEELEAERKNDAPTRKRLSDLASKRDLETILKVYNASKEAKPVWVGKAAAAVFGLDQQQYIDAVFQILRRRSGPEWELAQGAFKKYLPQLSTTALPAVDNRQQKEDLEGEIRELEKQVEQKRRELAALP